MLPTISEDACESHSPTTPKKHPCHECSEPGENLDEISIQNFEVFEGGTGMITLCRRKKTGVVYAMRRVELDGKEDGWLEREVLESIKAPANQFLWKLHWSFESTQFLTMILVGTF